MSSRKIRLWRCLVGDYRCAGLSGLTWNRGQVFGQLGAQGIGSDQEGSHRQKKINHFSFILSLLRANSFLFPAGIPLTDEDVCNAARDSSDIACFDYWVRSLDQVAAGGTRMSVIASLPLIAWVDAADFGCCLPLQFHQSEARKYFIGTFLHLQLGGPFIFWHWDD